MPWPNRLASRRKFSLKPELAYGVAMCDQKARQLTQVAKVFHTYTDDLRSTCVDLRWVATVKNLRRLTYEFELDLKSTQVDGQTKSCINLRIQLARDLDCTRREVLFECKSHRFV